MISQSRPLTVSKIQECIRDQARVGARGGGTKTALQPVEGVTVLEMTDLRGILDYQPEEFTITAWAGSRLMDVQQELAKKGQFLPFDPVLVEKGGTLGGAVASGLSGPGRYRFGGVRDFLLGVKFVDGSGNLVNSGGKVVKNAAGFDLAKFMVGSLGKYGLLVELSFKVFPLPADFITLQATYDNLSLALQALSRLAAAPLELLALDLEVHEPGCSLLVRLGGNTLSLAQRIETLSEFMRCGDGKAMRCEIVEGTREKGLWQRAREFMWVKSGHSLVKVPVTPRKVLPLDERLAQNGAQRRYSVGANLAWIAWPGDLSGLDEVLISQGLAGLVVLGTPGQPLIGAGTGMVFADRVKRALDPMGKF